MVPELGHGKLLLWGPIGTTTPFRKRTGSTLNVQEIENMGTVGSESFATLARRGINSLTTAMEYAHEMRLKFFAYQHMGAWTMSFPHESPANALHVEHPEWRCMSRDGIQVGRLSYVLPEVRRHYVEVLSEIASWGPTASISISCAALCLCSTKSRWFRDL